MRLPDYEAHSPNQSTTDRRGFLQKATLASLSIAAPGGVAAKDKSETKQVALLPNAKDLPNGSKPIKLFCCDLNWTYFDKPFRHTPPSAPQDWAFVNPRDYFEWHKNFGGNIIFCQAYAFGGYAFYPTKLGPVAPGPGQNLFPELFKLTRKAGMPFCSYISIAWDLTMSNLRNEWVIPTSRNYNYWGNLAPESPWTDLVCARIEESLRLYPVEWILFDMWFYGIVHCNDFALQPAWFVKKPFKEIIGRDMPAEASEITPEESMKYKREVMARQFYRIREAVRKASPETKIGFNVPYEKPAEPIWKDHPMLNESDMLFAESSDEVVPWLLSIRKPHQRVMTTIIGKAGFCNPSTWKRWYNAGCDFFGYAWGTPPDFRPHPSYAKDLEIVRRAYQEMP